MMRPHVFVQRTIKLAGHSVTQASLKLGIGRTALSSVLNGKASISISLALKLEKVYGIKADILLVVQLENDIQRERLREYGKSKNI